MENKKTTARKHALLDISNYGLVYYIAAGELKLQSLFQSLLMFDYRFYGAGDNVSCKIVVVKDFCDQVERKWPAKGVQQRMEKLTACMALTSKNHSATNRSSENFAMLEIPGPTKTARQS